MRALRDVSGPRIPTLPKTGEGWGTQFLVCSKKSRKGGAPGICLNVVDPSRDNLPVGVICFGGGGASRGPGGDVIGGIPCLTGAGPLLPGQARCATNNRQKLGKCIQEANKLFIANSNAAGVKDVKDQSVRDFTVNGALGIDNNVSLVGTVAGCAAGLQGFDPKSFVFGCLVSPGASSGYALAKTLSLRKFFNDTWSANTDYSRGVKECHEKYGY